jgi:hypothetical protein
VSLRAMTMAALLAAAVLRLLDLSSSVGVPAWEATYGSLAAVALLGCAGALAVRRNRPTQGAGAVLCLGLVVGDALTWTSGLPGLASRPLGAVASLGLVAELLVVLGWVASAPRLLGRSLRALAVVAAGLVALLLTPLGSGDPAAVTVAGSVSGHEHTPADPATAPGAAAPGASAPGTLDEQLAAASAAAAQWPTLGAARAQGWTPAETYVPGTGSHWMHYADIDSVFDPAAPEMLLFAGDSADAPLVGLTYYVVFTAPGGFTGEADVWHQHQDVCIGPEGPLFAGDGFRRCKSPDDWSWMLHAWVVPGWENPAGVFAMENGAV